MARVVLLSALLLALAAPAASADLVTRPVGSPPLSDAKAAAMVHRDAWEPRPENAASNRRVPTARQLRAFHAKSDMPYAAKVTGRFRGTTDEILQWGAYKWGFDPELFRAVAAVETWWKMDVVGDNGDSFGLMQMRRPYHCCLPYMALDTAFNVDYYGGILRSYYDGKQTWLNTVERGHDYGPGDLWGSVGAWASGRWYSGVTDEYVGKVQKDLADRVWTGQWF